MNLRITYYILKKLIIVFCSFLAVLSIFSCENSVEVIKSITAVTSLPRQYAENVEITYSDSGLQQVKIIAPRLEYYQKSAEDQYYEFPKGLKMLIYDHSQQARSSVTAGYAIYRKAEHLWEARDSVVAINQSGEILRTELLFWDEQRQIIYTDKFARVTDETSEIQGEGFEADENFTHWEFKKVTGMIDIKNEK